MTEGQSARPETQNILTTNTTMPLFRTAGRTLCSASVSAVTTLLEYNPSGGMWQATGTAIAHAPNATDLRSPDDVFFDVHGRGVRRVSTQDKISDAIIRRATAPTIDLGCLHDENDIAAPAKRLPEAQFEHNITNEDHIAPKVSFTNASKKAAIAAWRFILTPTGLFILVYGLNVVAWGAMLFFLLLNVGSMSKERKEIWIEIDSQILNALFCLTSWGLAPWRIRDTYWLLMWHFGSAKASKKSITQLAKRNSSWYRMRNPIFEESSCDQMAVRETLTGKVAPPTKTWKMDFVVINMLLNSLFQVGMAAFMWAYNRHTRPAYGVGLFIGLGCFSSLLAGIMSWWEGRKVKLIEGAFFEGIPENEKQHTMQTLA
ncbi:hypothetical protein N7497_005490 [Penicillium chrysogenum]|jgi:hypothetical protein|uniref:Uncharacterized protein n=1 Tax=Penicillium chrysogenum TaxID=5076 RepID=A0ABQ8WQ80_PENCH|nr:hypothetical protein N7505_003427 [Penicillium chrysogenum]KAJ6156605.1 hypothetical protein N7497_005490 [Penicillium chrysogenum]